MRRVAPSVRVKEEIDAMLKGQPAAETETPMRGFVQQLARDMLQVGIEAEATACVGRDHYRRGDRLRAGWRNGYAGKQIQSEAGALDLAVPQLCGTEERFTPVLPGRVGARTPELEALVRGMYVRGLSTRDVSALYQETVGTALSKSAVSRVTQQLQHDFDAWRQRDLTDLPLVYLFLDGQYHAARQGTDETEGVLSAYGILDDGRPVVFVAAVSGDVPEIWTEARILEALASRGVGVTVPAGTRQTLDVAVATWR